LLCNSAGRGDFEDEEGVQNDLEKVKVQARSSTEHGICGGPVVVDSESISQFASIGPLVSILFAVKARSKLVLFSLGTVFHDSNAFQGTY
jgi:hypothetical protein